MTSSLITLNGNAGHSGGAATQFKSPLLQKMMKKKSGVGAGSAPDSGGDSDSEALSLSQSSVLSASKEPSLGNVAVMEEPAPAAFATPDVPGSPAEMDSPDSPLPNSISDSVPPPGNFGDDNSESEARSLTQSSTSGVAWVSKDADIIHEEAEHSENPEVPCVYQASAARLYKEINESPTTEYPTTNFMGDNPVFQPSLSTNQATAATDLLLQDYAGDELVSHGKGDSDDDTEAPPIQDEIADDLSDFRHNAIVNELEQPAMTDEIMFPQQHVEDDTSLHSTSSLDPTAAPFIPAVYASPDVPASPISYDMPHFTENIDNGAAYASPDDPGSPASQALPDSPLVHDDGDKLINFSPTPPMEKHSDRDEISPHLILNSL